MRSAQSAPRVLLAIPRYRGANHALFLGIASLAAALKQEGIEVAVLDEDVAAYVEASEGTAVGETIRRFVSGFEPTLIGIHVNTPNYSGALSLASRLRQLCDAPIVAGGPHATVAAQSLLQNHRDIELVLRGEADLTLPRLAWTVAGRGSLGDVQGLSRWLDGAIVHQEPPPLLPLDRLAIPDRLALLEPPEPALRRHARATYQQSFCSSIPGFTGRQVAGAYATRGCHAGCSFCSPAAFWAEPRNRRPTRRLRPASTVLAEMRELAELGYGAVFFDEPTFPLASEPGWLATFCDGMQELGLAWGAPTRLDELDSSLLPGLARAGFCYTYLGLESPHSNLQHALDKVVDPGAALTIVEDCAAHGVQCDLSLFFGAPGETEATIDGTIAWIDRNLPRGNAFFSVAAFWPGTVWAEQQGLGPECWEPDYDRSQAELRGVVWYPESAVAIDRFYSNSTGTYHPAFMTIERALAIKERIIDSGFRARFSRHARATPSLAGT